MGTLSASVATGAQYTTGKMPLIGVLLPAEPESPTEPNAAAFRQGLSDLGYVEGRTVAVEYRYAHGRAELYSRLATELVRLNVEVIIVGSAQATQAASRATQTIPIVFVGIGDPVGIGLVASLARPGGNVTGLSDDQGSEIIGKRLQLLKEVAPAVSKLASLTRVPPSAAVPLISSNVNAFDGGAKALGLQTRTWRLQGPDDIDKAFAEIVKEGFGALYVTYTSITWINRRQILDLAARHRLPAIYPHRTYAADGGLMAYGEDEREVPRRLATYVDKILRGAKPADLPIQQPTKFDLVINLKTARAMGLTIPQAVLVQADEVIR